ncbi:class I SAM-dependent methyltransferase [Sporomusa termitida]|uniref:RumA: 23S rRNA (Uracil-5-)-methyltransferase RumA n=1 Tax=Sporomusa termitida TaxID=2377 RepID=A0A517DYH7_9FIRM|nr:class I SAM-dependent methyltransferase [Sporomusa termitida]QDR82401.1 rumA: 23S rRNA (uracil-5-)-methyltransferase RumA [Sporomusa termitida]
MKGLINWEALQKYQKLPFANMDEAAQAKQWGSFAGMYDGMAKLEKEFTKKQVGQMLLSAEDSVIDIGCGPGRLSVPVAQKVKSVTALDVSEAMLAKCMENARREGVHNITPMRANWLAEDAVETVGKYDIAIASRSVGFADLVKINRIARKYVFILGWANAPSLREIQLDFLEGIGQEKVPHDPDARMFGYNMMFNMVYDMGANPNIVVVEDGFERDYVSREQAYADLRFVGEIRPEFEEQYRSNVDRYLIPQPDGGFKLLRKTKTFVLWWRPDEVSA